MDQARNYEPLKPEERDQVPATLPCRYRMYLGRVVGKLDRASLPSVRSMNRWI
jgi:hypothetical protein